MKVTGKRHNYSLLVEIFRKCFEARKN